jgi:hypothetical protein
MAIPPHPLLNTLYYIRCYKKLYMLHSPSLPWNPRFPAASLALRHLHAVVLPDVRRQVLGDGRGVAQLVAALAGVAQRLDGQPVGDLKIRCRERSGGG